MPRGEELRIMITETLLKDTCYRKILVCMPDDQNISVSDLSKLTELDLGTIEIGIEHLRRFGMLIEGSHTEGYKIKNKVDLMEEQLIRTQLCKSTKYIGNIYTLFVVDSTSDYAMRSVASKPGDGNCYLAEAQTNGRGRRGALWISPIAENIYLSIICHTKRDPKELSGVSIVIGLAIMDAIARFAVIEKIKLKWPNDLLLDDKKIGGILIDMRQMPGGDYMYVIGIGLNIHMNNNVSIDQPWATLAAVIPGCSRSALAGAIIDEVIWAFKQFEKEKIFPFLDKWERVDALRNRDVKITSSGQRSELGVARGIQSDGALILQTDEGLKAYYAGEVSLRLLK